MNRIIVIGGSDAGISAALRAREVDDKIQITVIVADRFPNYSICGIPFFLSGEVQNWKDLAHRTAADIESQGIELLLEHRAGAIDTTGRKVSVRTPSGQVKDLSYDQLIVATGAVSVHPPIQGLAHPGVFFLRWMQDAFAVNQWLADRRPASGLVVGGGVTPEASLARAAGIETGVKGAVRVNQRMETGAEDVLAAGDCAETYHRLLEKNVYLPLGEPAAQRHGPLRTGCANSALGNCGLCTCRFRKWYFRVSPCFTTGRVD